jgi:DNA-binding transcriptional ArsR family regulator
VASVGDGEAKSVSAQLAAVARAFSVLSEPSRLALLEALRDGPLTVSELVEASGMKQANVSKPLGMLHQHRLVKRRREGICVRYEIADLMAFALCKLVCRKAGGGEGRGIVIGDW